MNHKQLAFYLEFIAILYGFVAVPIAIGVFGEQFFKNIFSFPLPPDHVPFLFLLLHSILIFPSVLLVGIAITMKNKDKEDKK
jgi:hypothetical protein